MLHEDAIKKAKKLFIDGYNCAQAVLKSTLEARDLKIPSITRIAAGFGGGLGLCGEVCGAVNGAVIAIGLLLEQTYKDHKEHQRKSYEYVHEFIRLFKEKHGSLQCKDLLGLDISNPENLKKANDEGLFEKVCLDYVATAIQLVLEMFPPCDAC